MPPQDQFVSAPQNPPEDAHQGKPRSKAFLAILFVLLILAGAFGVWYFLNPAPVEEPESLAVVDKFASWKTYRNEEYGFEFEYPMQTIGGKTAIFERENVVFVFPDNQKPSESYFSDSKVLSYGGLWAILVKSVNSDKEITDFVKNRYGKDCEWKMEKQPGSEKPDIVITTSYAPDEGTKDCFVNWITVMKYDPELKKLAVWDAGQAPSFWDAYPNSSYDERIINSFKFISTSTPENSL